METAALHYTIGLCSGNTMTFKPIKVSGHVLDGKRLILKCGDGSIISANLDKYDYKLYPDYKAAKEIKDKITAQIKGDMHRLPPKPTEELPEDANRI